MRNVSDNGVLFTSLWEQFRDRPYRATTAEEFLTVGFGHYGPDVLAQWVLTREQALDLLKKDMAKASNKAAILASDKFNQAQFDAIVDLCFNVGTGVIEKDAVLHDFDDAVRGGDIVNCRRIMAQFINQNGSPVLGLKRRTAGRLALFDGKTATEAEAIGRAVKG